MNVRKGAYYFTAMLNPSYTDSATGRAMAIDFAKQVVAKITGTPAPVTLVPALSEMPGWILDPAESKTVNGPAVATNRADAEALIDGGVDPFFVPGSYSAVGLAWEKWTKDPWALDLKVWQMASVADATKLWTDILSNSSYAQVLNPDGSSGWITCAGADQANPCP
jgi:hypothetical protein